MQKVCFMSKLFLINIVLVSLFVLVNTLAFSIPRELIYDNELKSQHELESIVIPSVADCNYTNEENFAAWIAMAYCEDQEKSALFNGINMFVPTVQHYFGAHNIKDAIHGTGVGESYTRYWHGAVAMLRFLLIALSYSQLLLVSQVIMSILFILTVFLTWRKDKPLSVFYAVSILLSTFHVVIRSCYHMVDYFVFFVVVLFTIIYLVKVNWNKFVLWMSAVGCVTCYFDGLVVPVLTIGFPLVLYVYIRRDYNCKNVMLTGFCWAFGYIFAIILKWILADIICEVDIFSYFAGEYQDCYNLHLPIIQYAKRISFVFAALFVGVVGLFYLGLIKGKYIDKDVLLVYSFVFLIPVAFCIADWHPFTYHYWMTHRNWAVSYFAVMCCLWQIYRSEVRVKYMNK